MNSIESLLLHKFNAVRHQSALLAEGLSPEDLVVQSMPDASPGKWHLAHTSWFFETFIVKLYSENFHCFNPDYAYLFNSYYDNIGSRHARPQRGMLTRPGLNEVMQYRDHVDTQMRNLILTQAERIAPLLVIGLHHEMQHQELFLTDILHLLSLNPLHPGLLMREPNKGQAALLSKTSTKMQVFDGGLVLLGAEPEDPGKPWDSFSYDCEGPKYQFFLPQFKLATRLVTNRQWLEFINDGAYDNPLLWLSDGWNQKMVNNWIAPLYWKKKDEQWYQFGLDGLQAVDLDAPVCHISYFEADAFAHWSGKRLPREQEWEYCAQDKPIQGNFLESYAWRSKASEADAVDFDNLYGDVWEWTQSAYSPYPGFTAKQGALGEYNGKFMANQFVLKGGSCVTPRWQMRASYRNFFYPHQRWQFTGLRLAEDI